LVASQSRSEGLRNYGVFFSKDFFPFVLPLVLKKIKAIPLQAWTGPEFSRRLRLLDFKTIGT
jgi:hypothetical protein